MPEFRKGLKNVISEALTKNLDESKKIFHYFVF